MKLDVLETTVKEIITDILGLNEVTVIDPTASLAEKYGFSSLDALQLIIRLEEKLNIVVPDEVIDDALINSVSSIVSYISNLY